MRSILKRFGDIIEANINDLIDKAIDPEEAVEKYLLQLSEDLAEVREAGKEVWQDESRLWEKLNYLAEGCKKYEGLARKALQSGSEEDARVFLNKKVEIDQEKEQVQSNYDIMHEAAEQLRQMHDKLVSDINTLKIRHKSLQARDAAVDIRLDQLKKEGWL